MSALCRRVRAVLGQGQEKVADAAASEPSALPDTIGVASWPGGGGRVSKYDDATWINDAGGAWVLLYAPAQFYDGLRLRAAAPTVSPASSEVAEVPE